MISSDSLLFELTGNLSPSNKTNHHSFKFICILTSFIIPINSTVNIWTYKFIFKYLNQHHHSDPTWNIDWGSLGHSRQRLVIPRSPYFEGLALKVDSIKSHGLCRLINRTELSGKKTSLLGFFLASNYR